MTQSLSTPLTVPLIGFGQVRHTRLHPQRNVFAYGTYFLMLPMRTLSAQGSDVLAINRTSWLSFFDTDHGDGRGPQAGGALAWVDELLRSEGIDDATGEAWLHCYPRVLGYTFNPVSFWYCHTETGKLRAIVVAVNNTFGERHVYLLDQPQLVTELRAQKVFHVSPFCAVEGGYRFRFMLNLQPTATHGPRTLARIDYDDARGPLIETSVSGALEPVTRQSIRKALWRYPVMTFGVMARIHWQALRLWLRKTHFFRKPEPPEALVSRQL
jgi:DUF1365 family protein